MREKGGDIGKNTMNIGVTSSENQTFISITTASVVYNCLFYRKKEREVYFEEMLREK